jgi:hypothetical protein
VRRLWLGLIVGLVILAGAPGRAAAANWTLNVFASTGAGGGINHYEKSQSGPWGGEIAAYGNFPTSPAAVVDAAGVLHVFASTPSGLIDDELAPGGHWTTETIAAGSFSTAPAALIDPAGNLHVFVATGGGINHYERGAGSTAWGGEIAAYGSFHTPPAVLVDPGPPPPPPPVSGTTTTPAPAPVARHHRHHRHRHQRARITVHWRTHGIGTRVVWIRFAHLARRARVSILCRGRGCPLRVARGLSPAAVRRLLDRRVFGAGSELVIAITAPGYVGEVAALDFRRAGHPLARLLAH